MNHPIVSVIIPTFGRPDTLVRAIRSVLSQTYPDVETIVVDDNEPGSAERRATELQMRQFADNRRIRYIQHKHNRNGAAARNTAPGIQKPNIWHCWMTMTNSFPTK